jgi:hypothetical protein
MLGHEHNREISLTTVEHFSGNLDVDAQKAYTLYFTAMQELFDAVLLDVQEIISQTAEAEVAGKSQRKTCS